MNFGKIDLTSADMVRLARLSRPLAAAFAAAFFHAGCMESSPGGSQGETQSQPQVMRAMAANPLCKVETHLLILDEDAIKNSEHCDCVRDRDHESDDDDEKCDKNSRGSRGSGGSGGNGGSISTGKDNKNCDKNGNAIGSGKDDKNCDKNGGSINSGRDNKNCDKNDGGNEAKVTICHIPPGNHDNGHTISVGSSAVKAHLAHGDKFGACSEALPVCNSGAARSQGWGGDNRGRQADLEKDFCEKSAIGKRTTVKFFADNVGREILLPSGSVGDEGWFAPTSIRVAWKTAGPEQGDGLRNYAAAGPGLGSPDAKGNRESLLDNVPDLTPLRALGLARLEGSAVCGIVLDGEVKMGYSPRSGNIQGPNLGKVAFQVLGIENGSGNNASELPDVRVRILDAEAVCADPLTAFLNAPAPTSQCEPRDVEKPSCSVLQTVVSENWDRFDSSIWRGDGGQLVQGGLFSAQPGMPSAAADYISPCPIPVESTSAVRFSNRLQLSSPSEFGYAESGALFFVNTDIDGSFKNFVFVNVGYTMSPSKVFVEMFGSSNDAYFDQYEETSLSFSPTQIFNVDLSILPNSFQIAVGEESIDTVHLATPITGIGLFEVGVQQNPGGLRGLVDMTTITKMCQKENIRRCRSHSRHQNQIKERLGRKCRSRNAYIRLAKEQIKHCQHPSMAMRVLAKMKETPE